jgi:hypothetical protein
MKSKNISFSFIVNNKKYKFAFSMYIYCALRDSILIIKNDVAI